MKKRILSLVLAVSLCTSLLVAPAHAAGIGSLSFEVLKDIALWLEDVIPSSPYVNTATYAGEHHSVYSYQTLEQAVFNWNAEVSSFSISDPRFYLPSYSRSIYFDLQPLSGTEFYAIRCFSHVVVDRNDGISNSSPIYDNVAVLGYWTDSSGNVAVCPAPTAEEEAATSVQAIPRSQAVAAGYYRMLSYEDLYNLAYDYNTQHNYKLAVNTDGVYWAISPRGEYVLADESGLPYGAAGPSSITSGGNSRPDLETGEDQLIDWSRGTVINENGDEVYYDGCVFDSSTKTYYIDNHTENYYYTYNYYIEKTYITYIGASAEYTETYERYYELPDGRSSADLTKEDLEQLNLSMDVVPYIRSSDDTRLRSLYHFDGNTEDASYWNYATSFDWTTGASLTYLESNAFNGCLYLDELAHDFTITLPSSLGSGDFTVDFRYYQAYTGTPNDDSYISIGGQEVLRLTGSNFTFNGTNYATPVGNWNHLAFVRKDGTLYFYLNGVRQGSEAFSNALSAAVQFSFGSSQQTYKYLDELRVTNFAVWDSNFTPATVPYDTNLSLVLPTDTVPVADEYWDIQCENNLLSEYNLDWWDSQHTDSGVLSSYFSPLDLELYSSSRYVYENGTRYTTPLYVSHLSNSSFRPVFPSLFGDSLITSFTLNDYTSVSSNTLDHSLVQYDFTRYSVNGYPSRVVSIPNSSINWCIYHAYRQDANSGLLSDDPYLPFGDYVLSMVSSEGDVGSYSFSWDVLSSSDFDSGLGYYGKFSDEFVFNGYIFSLVYSYTRASRSGSSNGYSAAVFLSIIPTEDAGEFVYLALEEGTESTVEAEFVSGVAGIPADDLNTPTLAVRSDIPITQKQIGGVRPTFAERGYVYAMVESGFITSLQQYTGYAWQAVDGRIWTGSRWIPYSSYNVITLSDMYDISDASGQGGYEYIYSQSGFWSWWQKQWLEFKQWYAAFSLVEALKPGGNTTISGDTINNEYNVNIDFGGARNGAAGLVDFVQKVLGGIGDGFASFTQLYLSPDDSLDVLFPANETDE